MIRIAISQAAFELIARTLPLGKRMQAMRKDGATYRAIGAVTGHGPRSVMRILERVGG